MITLIVSPSPLGKFVLISARFRERLNIFLQIGNWTEKRYPNLCRTEERQKQGLCSYLLCSLCQLAWMNSGPAKNIALPTVVDGTGVGSLGGVQWGDKNVDIWELRVLWCKTLFLSCIFQNNPWRVDYLGFAEMGNSVLIHTVSLNACKSVSMWNKTRWRFNFVCVNVWRYHAISIDVLEEKKNTTKPEQPNTNWLILDAFDPNFKKELVTAKWPKTSKNTGKPLMTVHVVWNVEDGFSVFSGINGN